MAHLKYFPEEFMQLQVELNYFPKLMEKLQDQRDIDPEMQFVKMLSAICAEFGIVMDGTYNEKELAEFAGECVDRMRKARSPIWTTSKGIKLTEGSSEKEH